MRGGGCILCALPSVALLQLTSGAIPVIDGRVPLTNRRGHKSSGMYFNAGKTNDKVLSGCVIHLLIPYRVFQDKLKFLHLILAAVVNWLICVRARKCIELKICKFGLTNYFKKLSAQKLRNGNYNLWLISAMRIVTNLI